MIFLEMYVCVGHKNIKNGFKKSSWLRTLTVVLGVMSAQEYLCWKLELIIPAVRSILKGR